LKNINNMEFIITSFIVGSIIIGIYLAVKHIFHLIFPDYENKD